MINLPVPSLKSDLSVEEAILNRRSFRDFSDESIDLKTLGQLLWAAQGVTSVVQGSSRSIGLRTAPSAGALYPLEIYIVVKRVEGLSKGIYHYHPGTEVNSHSLELELEDDVNEAFANATLGQDCIKLSAVSFIITSIDQRVADKYGDRAHRYCLIESGHAGQNILRQAESLGLGAVPVGAFYDDKVKKLLGTEAEPYYILNVGKK